MKKLLLSALALFAISTAAVAQEVSFQFSPADYAPETSGAFTFKNTKTGFSFVANCVAQGDDAVLANGGYIALSVNTNDYVISKVVVNAKNTSTLTSATLAGYAKDAAYTASETTWVNPLGAQNVSASYTDLTYNVNNTYFALVAPGNGVAISSFTVYYQPKETPEVTFAQAMVKGKVGQVLTAQKPTTVSTGAVTYVSSNTLVATVAGDQITLKGAGTCNITATVAAAGVYTKASASYELVVQDAATATTDVFNFSTAGAFGITGDETSKTIMEGNVIMTLEGTFTMATSQGANFLRFSKNATITVDTPDNDNVEMVLYYNSGKSDVVKAATYTVPANRTDVAFIAVTYAATGEVPALTFDGVEDSYTGSTITLPVATGADNIAYSIDGVAVSGTTYTFATSGVYWLQAKAGLSVAFAKLVVVTPLDVILEEGKAKLVDGKIYCANPEKYNWDVYVQLSNIPANAEVDVEVSGTYTKYGYTGGKVTEEEATFTYNKAYTAGTQIAIPAGLTGTLTYYLLPSFATEAAEFTIDIVGTGDQSTGIEAVEAEEGVAEYYNLQGIRVMEPAKGQLVIKKQGAKVSKVVF